MLACIVAGGKKGEFTPEGQKALATIHGKRMVDYVADALAATPEIDQVIVISDQENLIDSLSYALKQAKNENEYMLIVTCDIPFLTPEAVADFLSRCKQDADFYYPIVEEQVHKNRFPGIQRTFVKLKEGTFTGGNLFLVRPASLIPLLDRIEKILEARKSPIALSAELGFSFVLRLILTKMIGVLTIRSLETRIRKQFHIHARAVVSPFPEIANDVDRPADLIWAQKILGQNLPAIRK
ncbi:NTP transferase domain-containing protein [Effusibacillus dendaii]|uniref:MobA-like NTP transferase domain-containing protein n=1 Tax=Effusibacillus dendaii TaxID=2743772 RepID=A0A7I8DBQ3_9BACL|nr:NTP transferase domain-containing protein [Effusibacillus dendaii]BCJ87417.1 hypothetical protein skT53_24020 [Effusibacillus dendaii]